jgi:hypothetical protein
LVSLPVMTSPLDLWDQVPYVALGWIATAAIESVRFARAEINGRLPPRPFLFFVRQCISEGGAWTVVLIGNSAYSRGQITFVTLMALGIIGVAASTLIAGKTR